METIQCFEFWECFYKSKHSRFDDDIINLMRYSEQLKELGEEIYHDGRYNHKYANANWNLLLSNICEGFKYERWCVAEEDEE